jgi:hypothetical protein
MCVDLLMYSIASVCEVYTIDINIGVGGLVWTFVSLLIGFVVLVRQGLGVQVKGLGIPLSYGLVKFIRQINNRVVMYKLNNKSIAQ